MRAGGAGGAARLLAAAALAVGARAQGAHCVTRNDCAWPHGDCSGGACVCHTVDGIEWSGPRYRFVRKTIESVDLAAASDRSVVYVTGTLHGEWPDGTSFEGIRFIDRFELTDGLITRQDVWNDIAEERP